MRNSSPSFRPCRWAMTVGICSGTPGPAAGFSSRARCSQLKEPTSSSIWHDPPEQKEPEGGGPVAARNVHGRQAGDDRDDRLRSGHVGAESIDRLDRQAGVDVRGRPRPPHWWAAWVSDGPNASNGRTSSDLRIHTPSTTVTPSATPMTLSSVRRPSATKAARWIRLNDSQLARSLCIAARLATSRRLPLVCDPLTVTRMTWRECSSRPLQSRVVSARHYLIDFHHDN